MNDLEARIRRLELWAWGEGQYIPSYLPPLSELEDTVEPTCAANRLPMAHDLVVLARAYARLTTYSMSTISTRIFNDGKTLSKILEGSDITLGRYAMAVDWFSEQWPSGAAWPSAIFRPAPGKLRSIREIKLHSEEGSE